MKGTRKLFLVTRRLWKLLSSIIKTFCNSSLKDTSVPGNFFGHFWNCQNQKENLPTRKTYFQ